MVFGHDDDNDDDDDDDADDGEKHETRAYNNNFIC